MSESLTIEAAPTPNPGALMRMAADCAGVSREIVLKTACQIQGRNYVKVEGWQAIAVAHGCVASSRDVEAVKEGYRAIGEIRRISDGQLLAQAEGFVGKDEPTWFGGVSPSGKTLPKRPEYAIRAMAQTRAISRACRSAFAHVVVMIDSSLSTTPAEEVPDGGFEQVSPPQLAAPAQTKSEDVLPTKSATDVTKKWFLDMIATASVAAEAVEYFRLTGILLPGEELTDLPLAKVPISRKVAQDIVNKIIEFGMAKKGANQPPSNEGAGETWRDVICTVPRKGQKRDEYMESPETIGSLYDAAKGGDSDAQKRLFGFANHWKAEGWTKKDGTKMPPSHDDCKFRAGLDEFLAWREKQNSDHAESDDIPF